MRLRSLSVDYYPLLVRRVRAQPRLGDFCFTKNINFDLPANKTKKQRFAALWAGCIPRAPLFERSQLEIEQFLAMLRFENPIKAEELPGVLQ